MASEGTGGGQHEGSMALALRVEQPAEEEALAGEEGTQEEQAGVEQGSGRGQRAAVLPGGGGEREPPALQHQRPSGFIKIPEGKRALSGWRSL